MSEICARSQPAAAPHAPAAALFQEALRPSELRGPSRACRLPGRERLRVRRSPPSGLAARRDVLSVAGLCNPALSRPPQQGRDRPRKPLEPVPEDKV